MQQTITSLIRKGVIESAHDVADGGLFITLLDFPGKRSLEIHLIRQKHVQSAFNWIRRRAGQPPIMIPNPSRTKEEKH